MVCIFINKSCDKGENNSMMCCHVHDWRYRIRQSGCDIRIIHASHASKYFLALLPSFLPVRWQMHVVIASICLSPTEMTPNERGGARNCVSIETHARRAKPEPSQRNTRPTTFMTFQIKLFRWWKYTAAFTYEGWKKRFHFGAFGVTNSTALPDPIAVNMLIK